MAGLLHDVRKLILDRLFSDFFSHTLDFIHQKPLFSIQVEDEVLSVNHAHVGGYLAVSWKPPGRSHGSNRMSSQPFDCQDLSENRERNVHSQFDLQLSRARKFW